MGRHDETRQPAGIASSIRQLLNRTEVARTGLPMHVSLIVPAPFNTISGGYGYDRRIVSGLRDLGHDVEVVELIGAFPTVDDIAREAARTAWNRLREDTKPVIDGLALPAFAADAISTRAARGLIHHPVSLETGLIDAVRAALDSIERLLFPCLGRLLVTSDATAETIVEHFRIPRERIHIVVPGTDDAPRCPGFVEPPSQILTIGTLIPRKGHDVLLRALALLSDLDWHLTIVGSPDRDPAHARALDAMAGELAIAHRMRFVGEQVDGALETIWRGADIFALATWYEGYGMVIAEALKRGLPVVVTAGGAAGALVGPDAGCVCPVGDHVAVSRALRGLITDREQRHRMAERAWQSGQTLPSWQAQASVFANALG
jgi:glycosyltransferase involved in cell wall biosynthesis